MRFSLNIYLNQYCGQLTSNFCFLFAIIIVRYFDQLNVLIIEEKIPFCSCIKSIGEPSSMILPSSRTIIRSQSNNVVARCCEKINFIKISFNFIIIKFKIVGILINIIKYFLFFFKL